MKLLIVGLGSMGKRRARLTKGIDAAIQIVGVDTAESRRDEAKQLGLADAAYAAIAEAVAAEVGVDAVYAEVLPEDKAAFVRSEKAAGRKVIMIGDGVNDSPALSEADAGIAISSGAAIAREIADITISSKDLFALVTLRSLSQQLMARIHRNYRFIVSFNFSLIVLGVLGILPPTTSALLHNMSTLAISLKSMTNLLPEGEQNIVH